MNADESDHESDHESGHDDAQYHMGSEGATDRGQFVALARERGALKKVNRSYESTYKNFLQFLNDVNGEDEELKRPHITVANVERYFMDVVAKKANVLPRTAKTYFLALQHYATHDANEVTARGTFSIDVSSL